MTKEIAIRLTNTSKYYKLYGANRDRLKEAVNLFGKKYHRNYFALRNINLNVYKGEILGIVGRNGSGKSTLLKVITGVLQPNEGTINVHGKISALLELGTGFNPEFTGIENVYFYGVVNGFSKAFMQANIERIVEFADIGEFINQPLKTYSSGMKTRLGFAVAIHVSPDILILDEVLAVGDELFRRKCHSKMEAFLNRGTTILYVSHDVNSIIQMCTRTIFLHDGAILASGEPRAVADLYQNVLYSTPQNQAKMVETLRRLQENPEVPGTRKTEVSRLSEQAHTPTVLKQEYDSSDDELLSFSSDFLEELKPRSTVENRNEDIDIIEPSIKTKDGKTANVLVFGEPYLYSVKYHSRSEQSFFKVAFGFAIKHLRGTLLSSVDAIRSFKNNVFVEQFKPDELIELQFEFECLLPAGTYFVNSGLSTFETGEQVVLNRKIDILCFKVLDLPTRIFAGQFSCMRAVSIKTENGVQDYAIK